ncbi:MAG: MarR family winged helix-turn-helix transcriptional regulator [Spirochaetaceae bacterium]|nr:MarR family winged helix-turn-helix transcriptional regulator [Spirochaetaceae bacterium]
MNSEESDVGLLRSVTRAYSQAQRFQAGCCGLSSSGCQVLCAIGAEGVAPQGEIGARLGLEKSWVSRALDGLERAGLVERRKCCADARMYDIAFTAAGRDRFEELDCALSAQARAVMSRIPKAERPAVRRGLQLLAEALASVVAECGCGEEATHD